MRLARSSSVGAAAMRRALASSLTRAMPPPAIHLGSLTQTISSDPSSPALLIISSHLCFLISIDHGPGVCLAVAAPLVFALVSGFTRPPLTLMLAHLSAVDNRLGLKKLCA